MRGPDEAEISKKEGLTPRAMMKERSIISFPLALGNVKRLPFFDGVVFSLFFSRQQDSLFSDGRWNLKLEDTLYA